MVDGNGDPRVFFAAERTLLAWLRTGIGVMAFGFVVARFGLFLRLLRTQGNPVPGHGESTYLGAGLVLLGVAAVTAGAVEYQRFGRKIRPEDLPAARAPLAALLLAWSLALVGVALLFVLLT